ncbi:MAG: hypothetical protein AB4040_03380 [Synechococcus sp.]
MFIARVVTSSLLAAGALAASFLPARPASAQFIQDTLIGAGGNAVYGEIFDNGNLLENALGGAAAGAAVSVTHDENKTGLGGYLQDAAVGAAASAVTGAVLNNGSLAQNAIGGAATGVLVNVTTDYDVFGGL